MRQEITPTYQSWKAMVQRCTNPNNEKFPRYGGRGVNIHPPGTVAQSQLAIEFGVSQCMVGRIIRGLAWAA